MEYLDVISSHPWSCLVAFIATWILVLRADQIVAKRKAKDVVVLPGHCSPDDIDWNAEKKCWDISGHSATSAIMRRPEISANFLPSLLRPLEDDKENVNRFALLRDFFAQWIIFQDSPRRAVHTDEPVSGNVRSILSSYFTSDEVETSQATVTRVAEELVQELVGKKEFDAVSQLSILLPTRVIMEKLGLDKEHEAEFVRWSDLVEEWFGGEGAILERCIKCQKAIEEYYELIERTRRTKEARQADGDGGNDIISRLLDLVKDGKLEWEAARANIFFLMSAGHETTSSLISNTLYEILMNPQLQQAAVKASIEGNKQYFADIVEESLRLTSPIKRMWRECRRDITVRVDGKSRKLKAGDMIAFINTDINHDPRRFPSPRCLQPERFQKGPCDHMAFGVGDHLCIGSRLARLEATAVLEELFKAFPQMSLRDRGKVVRKPLDSINQFVELVVMTNGC